MSGKRYKMLASINHVTMHFAGERVSDGNLTG